MRLRPSAALVLVLLTCCGAEAETAGGLSGAKAGAAPAATRVCDLISEDEVRSIYAGMRIELTDYAGPVGPTSFDSCQITVDHGTTTSPLVPFLLQVSIDPVTPGEHREMLARFVIDGLGPSTELTGLGDAAHFVGAGFLQVYDDERVLRVQGGGDENAIQLAELVLPRLPDLAPAPELGTEPACDAVTSQAEAVLGAPAETRRDRQTVDELRCEWSAGREILSATIRGYGDEVGRMWSAERPGAETIDVGGLRDNGVYMRAGGIYLWMGDQQVGLYLRHRPHVPADDRAALARLADAFAPSLLDVAPRVGPARGGVPSGGEAGPGSLS
ncbi:hypothetical protein E1262_15840 [Jiangella aurantiaca]|uniref:DUF3558 domain-containing protein n=1 Tax=Jiangella aurantiaca TaxID=2530373 RepID=A0A4R5A8X4_9ACTN|nr:hypothetical protein [Jiangella aurantiaca]TDD68491.1 hypothetical protein E1262_15840 [Jiangella aurantiaca]